MYMCHWNIHKQFLNLIFILFDTHLFFRLEVTSSYSPVVLNLCSIEPQGFGESVSGFRRQEILSNKTKKKYSRHTFYFTHYEGFDNCKDETYGVQYLQQKNHTSLKHCTDIYIHTVIIIHSQWGIQPGWPVLLCSSWVDVVALSISHI